MGVWVQKQLRVVMVHTKVTVQSSTPRRAERDLPF